VRGDDNSLSQPVGGTWYNADLTIECIDGLAARENADHRRTYLDPLTQALTRRFLEHGLRPRIDRQRLDFGAGRNKAIAQPFAAVLRSKDKCTPSAFSAPRPFRPERFRTRPIVFSRCNDAHVRRQVQSLADRSFGRSTDGADADIYRDTVRPLWQALHLSPVLDDTMRTYDASAQPLAGLGLFYTPDDIARLARWVADGALIDGQPVLDQSMLNAALQRDPNDRGLEAG